MAGRVLARYVSGERPQLQAPPGCVLCSAASTHGRNLIRRTQEWGSTSSSSFSELWNVRSNPLYLAVSKLGPALTTAHSL